MWGLKKSLVLLFVWTSVTLAEVEPLFYKTYNFAEEDTLNIRKKPNYRSKKVGELYLGRGIQLFECIKIKGSKWCKVEALDFPEAQGWVNAKYIKPTPYQEGYVTIEGLNSDCAYALKCEKRNHKNQCLVVTGFGEDMEKISLETQWFNRNHLTPATRFSAMPNEPGADGYCNSHLYIDAYMEIKKDKKCDICCTPSPLKSSINTKTKIDYTEYLPQKSMIKTYMNKAKAPWLEKEEFGEGKIKITVKKNKIIFHHEQEPISYETELGISKKFITEYSNGFEKAKTNRFSSVGEVTTVSSEDEHTLKKCILTNLLNEFSHGGYHYVGEIIHENCTEDRTNPFKGKSKKVIDTYDRYSQKGVGVIAIINEKCYLKDERYNNDQEGCASNGYSYEYYIK